MNKLIKLVFLLLAVTTLQAETKTDQAVGSQLPDSIRSLLIEEMQAINEGMAKILTGAARAGNTEQQLQLYQSMQAACVACHQQHATDRFPNFLK